MTQPRYLPSLWTRFDVEPDRDLALEAALLWLNSLPSDLGGAALESAIMGRDEPGPTLAARLRSAGLPNWADRVDSMGRGEETLQAILGRALVFQAGLRFATTSTSENRLAVSEAAFDRLPDSEHGPARALAPLLVDDPAARARLEAALEQLAREVGTHPLRLAWGARPRELDPVTPTTRNLWSSAYAHALVRHPWAYAALRVDPQAYARRLHALPIGLAHTTVMFADGLGLSELAALLRAAPPGFSEAGVPVASAALYALLERVHVEFGKDDAGERRTDGDEILDAVFSRNDSVWLARSWAQRVLWEVSHQAASRTQSWPGRLFDALTTRLGPWSADESHRWIGSESLDLWQADRVLVEAAVLLNHDDRAAAAQLLSRVIEEGRVADTGRERALSGGMFEAALIGRILGPEELPRWFTALWDKTYARRERCRIGSHQKIDGSARAALAWGLAGLNASSGVVTTSWDAIFRALQEVYLLDSFTFVGEAGVSIFNLAAALCTALVKRKALPSDRLATFVGLVIEPTINFAGFIGMMAEQDEPLALAAARAVSPDRVRWALDKGTLSASAAKKTLRAEVLTRVEAFARKL